MIDDIAQGRTDLVFDWTEGGGDPRATDGGGTPIIRWCAYYGDVSAIRHLLGHGETIDSLGANLDLNGAAFHGHWQLCAFLIEQGANPNMAIPETGETPLHAAASTQRPAPNSSSRCCLLPAPILAALRHRAARPAASCATVAPRAKPRSIAPPLSAPHG